MTDLPLKALVVDDDAATRQLALRWLGDASIECEQAATGEEALRILAAEYRNIGVVILDIVLPDISGYDIMVRLKKIPGAEDIPVILLTAHANDETDVIRSLEGGAVDHLSKPMRQPVLVARVRASLDRRRAQLALRERLAKAEELATTDPLTELLNRREFEVELEREISYCGRHRSAFGLLVADVDHFKSINDRFGHDAGDQMLRGVAEAIRACIRTSDRAFRLGGEEFGILLRGADAQAALHAATRLLEACRSISFAPVAGADLSVTLSIGVAVADGSNGFRVDELFQRADQALYAAKHAGRDQAVLESGGS